MLGAELRLHPIDQLKHVFLIAPRKGERTNGFVNGAEGLMDPIQVCGFHGSNLTQPRGERKRVEGWRIAVQKLFPGRTCNRLPGLAHKQT